MTIVETTKRSHLHNNHQPSRALSDTAKRNIWICADDYGLSPGVNAGIRELIRRGRLNATSVMTADPQLSIDEALALSCLNKDKKCVAIGLHTTLTAPFKPLSKNFMPLHEGRFLRLQEVMHASMKNRLQLEQLTIEINAQLERFIDIFGCTPDFIDGHQHVQLFPQVRDAFLEVVSEKAPRVWVRQCGRANSFRNIFDYKAIVLDALSIGFRHRAKARGLIFNPAFAGTYNSASSIAFSTIFRGFLCDLPDRGLIICHPGFIDDQLRRLDPMTESRERELFYLNSDEFDLLLKRNHVALIDPSNAV